MGGGAAGDGEGHDEGLPALCLGDGGGGVSLREEVIEGVNHRPAVSQICRTVTLEFY